MVNEIMSLRHQLNLQPVRLERIVGYPASPLYLEFSQGSPNRWGERIQEMAREYLIYRPNLRSNPTFEEAPFLMQLEEELALRVQMLAAEYSERRPLRFVMTLVHTAFTPFSNTREEQPGLALQQARAVFIGMQLLRSVAEKKHNHFHTCDCKALRKVRVIWMTAQQITDTLLSSVQNQLELLQLDWTPPQLMLAIARELTLLEQMLAKECRSCKDGDGALTSLQAGCSGVLVSFFEEFIFSRFGTRLRADHRRSLCASRLVTDIASALADGSEHSVFCQKSIFGTLTQSTGRIRRGYLDFIGGSSPRWWTVRLTSSSSWYSRLNTQIIDLKSLVLDKIDSGCVVTIVDLDRQLSLLDLGLTKAHRSCVDGDGAASVWTIFTPELKLELSSNLFQDGLVSAELASSVDYRITDTQLSALQTMVGPFHLKCASPGTTTPAKLTVLLTLGHQCLACTSVGPGADSTRDVVDHDCSHCGERTAATRVWLARAANPLIVRAQLNLMVNEQRDANVVKKLDFSTLMLL
jgi:hypothetical protein